MNTKRPRFGRLGMALALLLFVCALLSLMTSVEVEPLEAAPKPTKTPTPTRTPTPQPTPVPVPGTWKLVASANAGMNSNRLNGIASLAANDIWVVGEANYAPLTMHWNGTAWSVVPSPDPPGIIDTLSAVAAVASNDVWAVGTANLELTLIMHWDGVAWSIVPSPNVPGVSNNLTGIAAVAANDVWAVGYSGAASTLVLRWNGTDWSIVSSPSPSTRPYNYLYGVTAVAANNVWAVGTYGPVGHPPLTLVERWNGSAWSVVASPNALGPAGQEVYNRLEAVDAVSANDIWAVGVAGNQTLIERWNGSSWSIVPSPNRAGRQNFLTGVAAVAANNVWAVGYAQAVQTDSTGEFEEYFPDTLIMHWDGAVWSIVPSPNPSPIGVNSLRGVTVVSATDVWAAGEYHDGTVYRTLTERYTVP